MEDHAPLQGLAPYKGDEYLDSIRDSREVWIHGERVKDVTRHPAFRNSARMVARWYDRLNAEKDTLGVATDTGSGGWTHPFFKAPRSAAERFYPRCGAHWPTASPLRTASRSNNWKMPRRTTKLKSTLSRSTKC